MKVCRVCGSSGYEEITICDGLDGVKKACVCLGCGVIFANPDLFFIEKEVVQFPG